MWCVYIYIYICVCVCVCVCVCRASQMVLVVKSCLPMQEMPEMWVRSLSQEDILEKEMATHPVYLPMEILWIEDPGGPQSVWSQRVAHK